VISGGASAVYGADAGGGVVNFILKANYEGATVDIRFGDTEQGGDQTVTISGLIGANVADDRGNVMLGIERDTRSKELQWQRDWRVADFANPRTAGGGFAFGSATYFTNPPQQTPSAYEQQPESDGRQRISRPARRRSRPHHAERRPRPPNHHVIPRQ
jgi:outer membrane receptor protein involved in Fe transport